MPASLLTIIALIAFAANSLLCRLALAGGSIDAWSFTIIRLLSAAFCLSLIMALHTQYLKRQSLKLQGTLDSAVLQERGNWISSLSLLVYALCFSLAYVELATGTGALILFSAVQLTMMGWGIYNKEQLSTWQWLAFVVAVLGFIYLMLPSVAIPSVFGAMLMAISGVAWGIYSIRGKSCGSPLRTTGFNFIRSLVALPVLLVFALPYADSLTIEGILLACASGAVASGLGYSIWYLAMPLLKSTQAAAVQLCVPILAALSGVVFLAEPLTLRFILVSAVILGAVLVFIKTTPMATGGTCHKSH